MARLLSRRTSQTLLVLLTLFLIGTVGFLSAVRSYFSIDAGAIIRSEELGTWEEIQMGAPESSLSWKARYPWLAKALSLKPQETTKLDSQAQLAFDDAIAQHAAEAAKAAGFGDDGMGFIPTGRNNTPKAWDPVNDPPEKIPRIIHQTWKEKTLPPNWQAVRDECARMHPDYKYMLWTDADSREFIAEHYSWFIPIFDAYPYAIQRADAIRYFILHKYGGIYMDLDVGCLRRFDPLLRFEVVLPKTIPVGVSNDVMATAPGHPFMDHLIHNLVTFNHRYLTHYPTVMFSTGPMFVSASYGLYVDAHGLAAPSTPVNPSAGFKGIRVLPKSLYGKNAKPSEAPDAFFRHFYGSSWHAGDAGFLIFLREHGRFLIFVGFIVVMYGVLRSCAPRILLAISGGGSVGGRDDRSRRSSSRRRGHWITLPFIRDPRSGQYRSLPRSIYTGTTAPSKNFYDESTQTSSTSPSSASGEMPEILPLADRSRQPRVAAPRPHRAGLPLFELGESEHSNEDDDMDLGPGLNSERVKAGGSAGGIFGWMHTQQSSTAASGSRPPSSASLALSSSDFSSPTSGGTDCLARSGSMSKFKDKASGILYLPAYLVGSGGSSSASSTDSNLLSARTGADDEPLTPSSARAPRSNLTQAHARSSSNVVSGALSNWAASFLPRSSGGDSTSSKGGLRQDDDEGDHEASTLQRMWGGVSLNARTPSPSMFLNSTFGRRRSDDRERRDLESSGSRQNGLHHQTFASASSLAAASSKLHAEDVQSNLDRSRSTRISGAQEGQSTQAHDSSSEVIIAVDEAPPPPYERSRQPSSEEPKLADREGR